MDSITDVARQVLRLPRQDRRGLIDAHPEPELLKQEIIRLWTKHKNYRVHLHGRTGSIPMMPTEGATLDEAHSMAVWQFGPGVVLEVVPGSFPDER